MSKKTKVITSNIQPNPKEAEIWAKVNKDGSREVKQYNNSTGKFECCGGSGSGSGSGSSDGITMEYYRIDWDKANDIIARFDYGPIYRSTLVNAKTDYDCYIIGQTSLIAAGEFGREKIIKIGCISDNKEIVKDISTGDMDVYEGSTWLDFIKNRYTDVTDWSWLIPITEEEFYTMNDDEYPSDMPT